VDGCDGNAHSPIAARATKRFTGARDSRGLHKCRVRIGYRVPKCNPQGSPAKNCFPAKGHGCGSAGCDEPKANSAGCVPQFDFVLVPPSAHFSISARCLLLLSPFHILVLGWRISTARAASFNSSANQMSECLQVLIFVEEMKSPISTG